MSKDEGRDSKVTRIRSELEQLDAQEAKEQQLAELQLQVSQLKEQRLANIQDIALRQPQALARLMCETVLGVQNDNNNFIASSVELERELRGFDPLRGLHKCYEDLARVMLIKLDIERRDDRPESDFVRLSDWIQDHAHFNDISP